MPITFETDPRALPRHRYAGALDGPEHEVSYPKGHHTGFVTAVYKARIISGPQHPVMASSVSRPGSNWENCLAAAERFSRALLHATGHL